jgi:hypothetical protein
MANLDNRGKARELFDGSSRHIQEQFGDFQNLILRAQFRYLSSGRSERIAVNTGKIKDCSPGARFRILL